MSVVFHGVSVDQNRLKRLFRDMVDIYSPSGKEEDLTAFLWEYLAAEGLAVKRQPVDETRCNLLVSSGRALPETLFLGHIDTIAAFDIDKCSFEEQGGVCSGLGTADMKGGCAALIEAFLSAAMSDSLPDNVMLSLVVGEEESGDGTRALLKEYPFKNAVVAEPTDLKPCLDHYGYIEMSLRTFGERRHAAMSGRETNAIRAMLRFLLRLEERVEGEEFETVLNIRDLHSSESGFAVPDRCSVSADLHIEPHVDLYSYLNALRLFVERDIALTTASHHELDFPTISEGYRVDANDPFCLQLQSAYRGLQYPWEVAAFRSHSDAGLLHDAGCVPVVLGPGQLAKAHTPDESVQFDQVLNAALLYSRLLSIL